MKNFCIISKLTLFSELKLGASVDAGNSQSFSDISKTSLTASTNSKMNNDNLQRYHRSCSFFVVICFIKFYGLLFSPFNVWSLLKGRTYLKLQVCLSIYDLLVDTKALKGWRFEPSSAWILCHWCSLIKKLWLMIMKVKSQQLWNLKSYLTSIQNNIISSKLQFTSYLVVFSRWKLKAKVF